MTDDLISRKSAIDALDGEIEITGRTNAQAVKGYVRLVRDRLERLPSAEPKKGKWIKKSDPYGFFDEIPVCSECGCTTKIREEYKYCPNCGAKMEVE